MDELERELEREWHIRRIAELEWMLESTQRDLRIADAGRDKAEAERNEAVELLRSAHNETNMEFVDIEEFLAGIDGAK